MIGYELFPTLDLNNDFCHGSMVEVWSITVPFIKFNKIIVFGEICTEHINLSASSTSPIQVNVNQIDETIEIDRPTYIDDC